MHRNYVQRKSYCSCNQCNDKKDADLIDDTCKYVQNNVDIKNECECGFNEENNIFPENPTYAQSYVPWQTMNKTFIPSVGLKMGTIFPELVSPYMPGDSMKFIEYIKKYNKMGEGCNR